MTEVAIYDYAGLEQDAVWLQARYGYVDVSGSGDYGLVEMREHKGGSNTLVVTVQDQYGAAIPNVTVDFGWPEGLVHGSTNHEGAVGFAMGNGAYYTPPGPGPHFVSCGGVTVVGLGMVMGTNHDHLDIVYVETDEEGPPEPPPDPEDEWALMFEKLDRIIELLESIAEG